MISSLPVQRRLQLTIDERTPLVPMQTAKIALGINEDSVMVEIEDGRLRYAFDARSRGSRHAMPLIWRDCITAMQNGWPQPDVELDDAICCILLPPRPGEMASAFRAVQVRALLGACSQLHVWRLIQAGLLALDAGRPVKFGRAQSPWITRASLAEFLRTRRMV
jgi:hypothetical protein